MTIYDVIIIGSGPAAYTAGIYTARANLKPLIFEGVIPGGQLITTTIVENYPGFSDGIDGNQLMLNMQQQAENAGCILIKECVIKIDIPDEYSQSSQYYRSSQLFLFTLFTNTNQYKSKSIIIATGATAKKLTLPNGEKFWNKGISACATCDGALRIFRNKPLAVVGGGDTACEEAMHLSKFGSVIYIIVRSDKMRASKIMQKKVLSNNKIKIIYNSNIVNVEGSELLESAEIVNSVDNSKIKINLAGLFYAIGHEPNTSFLDNQIEIDNNGYIITKNTKTNIPGVFACGDVQDFVYRQAITAAGSGCIAALECEKYLETLEYD